MEAHVLMPSDLALAWHGTSGLCVCARRRVERGTRFRPDEGAVRLGCLPEGISTSLTKVLRRYGSYDEVVREPSGRVMRCCNWLCFLRLVDDDTSANLRAVCDDAGRLHFETMRAITARSPLLLNVSLPSTTHSCTSLVAALFQEGPLDLSQELMLDESVGTSVVSNNSCPSEIASTQSQTTERTLHQQVPVAVRLRGQQRALLPCEVCGKEFDRPSLLKRHMRTHTGERPHACSVCEKRFSTSSSLNTHRRIHSGEKPHQCGVCGKRFTASSNLYYHRMTHTKDKPHKCALCLKSFPTPGDLRSHQYVHSGAWPFRCGACGRGFSKQTNLRNHLFLHTGDKPHACSVCGKRFALACNLRAHAKTHEDEDAVASARSSEASSPVSRGVQSLSSTVTETDKIVSNFIPWDLCSANSRHMEMERIAAFWSSSLAHPGLSMEQRLHRMFEAQMLLGLLQQQQATSLLSD